MLDYLIMLDFSWSLVLLHNCVIVHPPDAPPSHPLSVFANRVLLSITEPFRLFLLPSGRIEKTLDVLHDVVGGMDLIDEPPQLRRID